MIISRVTNNRNVSDKRNGFTDPDPNARKCSTNWVSPRARRRQAVQRRGVGVGLAIFRPPPTAAMYIPGNTFAPSTVVPGGNYFPSAAPVPVYPAQFPASNISPGANYLLHPNEKYMQGPAMQPLATGPYAGSPGEPPAPPRLGFNPPEITQQQRGGQAGPIVSAPAGQPSTGQPYNTASPVAQGTLEVPVKITEAGLVQGPDGVYCRLGVQSGLNYVGPDGTKKILESKVMKLKKLGDWPAPPPTTPPATTPLEPPLPQTKPPEPCDSQEWEKRPQLPPQREEYSEEVHPPVIKQQVPLPVEPPVPAPSPPRTNVVILESLPQRLEIQEGWTDDFSPIIIGSALFCATAVAIAAIIAYAGPIGLVPLTLAGVAAPVAATSQSMPVPVQNGPLCKHGNLKSHCQICLEPATEIEFQMPAQYLT